MGQKRVRLRNPTHGQQHGWSLSYHAFDYKTEILVASVRGPMHIVEAARMGADVCTCPPSVLEACFKHPLTDIGLEKFLKDWASANKK